jgi:hypothetical protein
MKYLLLRILNYLEYGGIDFSSSNLFIKIKIISLSTLITRPEASSYHYVPPVTASPLPWKVK